MNVPDDAVLFDMDGVLVDSETYWHRFENDWVYADAISQGSPDHEEITGMNYREIYDYLSAEYGTTLSKEEFVGAYDDHAESVYGENVVLMNGANELFDDIRDAGRKLAIVSSAPQAWIAIVRDRFGLDPLDLVLSADDIDDPGKPEPHIYEHAAAELGLEPEDCVVVEDSVHGIAAAAASGAFTVAYRSTHNAELDLSAADVVVDGPDELRDVLLD
ncbi:HAD family hydrolase [Halogeometricum limi]|uniref:Haloacid dehalogenase superfamily, subfamily IA, variant 3 with third motif having DD or ED/haloacid dehalogenase superfamily, subfamily IA, variant 1 with third motif having Dx(3-4)D or Dx(3-4)E n=1 Tax=Halogeometricum limi TaxID=555875 RepID=A0A1I6FPL5_9EURY|nr:HAD family phosphatase [Halogeometricum limi]SFR31885.1 haloacid dehalogenase superfamily, subfamily IA, variant 3 with third motif having DD or ED/haloacid dehalogenase superfamily, subfamily IA, variant 1 with third motif having Dx(3-4)D or Dx(3-4)E [Halogeometricum limi]